MTNPFDRQDGMFLVLVNDEGQHSLWPSFSRPPGGWTVALGESTREAALAYVEEHWRDMRPVSVREPSGAPGDDGAREAATAAARPSGS